RPALHSFPTRRSSDLCDAIENDLDLGASVFKRMDRLSYAGAAISQGTLEKLYRLTSSITGRRIPVMSGYGTTETAPTISTTHWADRKSTRLNSSHLGI